MTQECSGLWPQQTVAAFGGKIPYVLKGIVTKHVRNFAAEGGHSLLWPEATTFLSLRGAYSRPEAATVAKDL